MRLSFQKVFYVIATVVGLFTILILARTVLIPLSFALLFAFILFPVTRKLETWGTNVIMSAFLSILAAFLLIGGFVFLFSNQIVQLTNKLPDFKDTIYQIFTDATLFINKNIGILSHLEKGELFDKIKGWLSESGGTLLSQTFSGTADLFFGLITAIVFTFLILIYRNGLVRGFVHFYPQEKREKAFKMFKSVQKVGQQYLFGMIVIVLILGFVNSFGLWIIGIDNPFLFGFLAAALALIPYAGTLLGAAIPILYALIAYDSLWMPITIGIFFWAVQFLESNFLTPKIVGSNLHINAFTAILSIIIGAMVWGIAGMVLFLPFAAMLKVFCEEYEELKPISMLMGEQNYSTKEVDDNFVVDRFKKIKNWFT
nr:AI-2E family transporter [Saprospiraceae bacterium]